MSGAPTNSPPTPPGAPSRAGSGVRPGAERAERADGAERDVSIGVTVERVVYENPDSQWVVARARVEVVGAQSAGDDAAPTELRGLTPEPERFEPAVGALVTIVGAMIDVLPGIPLRLLGRWEIHKKHGRQFRVNAYHRRSPETVIGIERYLSSGVVPGIGPELAKRIVSHFGLDTIEVIEHHPKRLHEVDGIGAARAQKIASAWDQQRELHQVMVFLRTYGVSAAQAVRIHKRYGSETMHVMRENPYRLALDIWGIGFKTADAIAQNLGMEPTASARLEAGLIHILGKLGEDGHVHVPESQLVSAAAEMLSVDPELLPIPLLRLDHANLVVREVLGDRGACVSLAALWEQEHEAAASLVELVNTPMRPLELDIDHSLARFEVEAGLQLTGEQRRAVESAVMDKCVVITGGPGVGKTTIVRAIVNIFQEIGREVGLAAPTGRAAKRLSESTGVEAVTLHRLLEFQPQDGYFARSAGNPLEHEVVIVDETSMVDIGLFRSLLVALPRAAQLVLVGDVDQLPSVGPGSVLADVIASEAATVVRLSEIFRQAQESRIVTAAHEINRGEVPTLEAPPGTDPHRSDFYFIGRSDIVKARETIVELAAVHIPESFGYDSVADIQILCPIHRGELGTIALNQALQARLNPATARGGAEEPHLARGDRKFRVGDKVMQLRNDYERGVFNGDIGIVCDLFPKDRRLVVDFLDERTASYEQNDLDQLTHAYAVSVHKSQGSEYPVVIVPLVTQHYMMLQRNLLYTAITRGKSLVVLVGSVQAVSMATSNHNTSARFTWLAERIRADLRI